MFQFTQFTHFTQFTQFTHFTQSCPLKAHLLRITCIWNVGRQVVHDLRIWLWLSTSIENLPLGILAIPSWVSLASNTCRQAILCCAILVLTSKQSLVRQVELVKLIEGLSHVQSHQQAAATQPVSHLQLQMPAGTPE